MKLKLKDIIELLSDRHEWSIHIDGQLYQNKTIRKEDVTYKMLNMYVGRIGTCLHAGVEHLVLELWSTLELMEGGDD